MFILSWVLYAVGFFGLCIVLLVKNHESTGLYLLGAVLALMLWLGGVINGGVDKIEEKDFTKEVMMTEVPVQGIYVANATIQITYKNGKLDKVELVPATTKKSVK